MVNDQPRRDAGLAETLAAAEHELALASTLGRDERRLPQAGSAEASAALARGAVVGRLVVVERLGAGGMGVVYSAYDPDLDRKVALKLILDAHDRSPLARRRLYSEAQALARLNHPNVVAVHDVGTHEGRVWLSMEFVAGRTLRRWWCEEQPGWREVVAVMRQAARGVAAAHRAGLLHRDLKPENIMVGADGRVRVMDFGLARVVADAAEQRVVPARVHAAPTRLTATGGLLGTPAYMAPEQILGAPADERSDLFSLCATIWEALYRQRAFTGDSLLELSVAVASGEPRAPAGGDVPRWLRRVVARGLAADRDERYASVDELLRALAQDPGRRRRRALVLLAAGVTLAASGYTAAVVLAPADEVPCERQADELAETWSGATRAAARAAVRAVPVAFAEETWTRIGPQLDAYAARWGTHRVEACRLHRVGERSDEAYVLQLRCLHQRRAGLEALSAVLTRADAGVLGQAVAAVAALPPIERCADPTKLASGAPPPGNATVAVAAQEVREQLARARAIVEAGRWDEALRILDEAEARAVSLGYAPLSAEVALRRGHALMMARRAAEAEEALTTALEQGLESDHDEVFAYALLYRVFVVASLRFEPARAAGDVALAMAVEPRFADDQEFSWTLANNVGVYHEHRRDFRAAEEWLQRAVAAEREHDGTMSVRAAFSLNNLAMSYLWEGELFRAEQTLTEASRAVESLLGAEHPFVSIARLNRVLAIVSAGRVDEARAGLDALAARYPELSQVTRARYELARMTQDPHALVDAATEILRQAEDARQRATWSLWRGVGLAQLGDREGARESLERARAHREDQEPDIEWSTSFGRVESRLLRALGEHDAAVSLVEETYARAKRALARDDTLVALVAFERALALRDSPRVDHQARPAAAFEEALDLMAAAYTPTHPGLAELQRAWGRMLLARGEPAVAAEHFQRAHDVLAATLPETNPLRAHSRAMVLRAQVEAGAVDLASARGELDAVVADLRARAPAFAEWAREHASWLAAR